MVYEIVYCVLGWIGVKVQPITGFSNFYLLFLILWKNSVTVKILKFYMQIFMVLIYCRFMY